MNKVVEKYVAKALEGYEANYEGITEAITSMEGQLSAYKEQQAEMIEGITEMKDLLGLKDEDKDEEGADHGVVNDGTAVV